MLKRRLGTVVCAGAFVAATMCPPVTAQGRVIEGGRLSLDQCLRITLENNLDLVSAGKQPEISEETVKIQDSAFDPELFAQAERAESEQEISNLFSLNESQSDTAAFGLSQFLRFGGDYQVSLGGGRSIASGPLVTTESTYGSTLNLTFNMPLLQGYGQEFNTEQLVLARNNLEVSRETFRIEVHAVMERAEAAYWDVLATQEALRIARLALKRAEDLLELNRKKVEVGTLAPIEITQAEAGVASEVERVILAETALENAEDELLRLMAVADDNPLWNQPLVIADRPSFEPVQVSLDEAISTALSERPEMFNAEQAVRNSELSERVARKARRPNLDLALSYAPSGNNFELPPGFGPDGIPGTQDDPRPIIGGRLLESIEEIPDLDNFSWSASLNFRYALGNKQAKAEHAIASINREKAEVDLANQEQTIRVEVRRAVREVQSGIKRVEAARKNVELQEKKLDAEQKKFDNGMSTSFEVLTFQNDLADAELAEVRARLDFIKALTALERVKGTLLVARGLSIAE